MKKFYLVALTAFLIAFVTSCATNPAKSVAYNGFYSQKYVSILVMPPINQTVNVDAKDYFYSSLSCPLSNDGYYVIPPFMAMEILKKESAYDSEAFLNASLTKFNTLFGADLVLFTVINKWEKSAILASNVTVGIEYIFKSTKTNEIVYQRKGEVVYSTASSAGGGGLGGLLLNAALSAATTATTNYMTIARACNDYTLTDLPAGKYSPKYGTDGAELSGSKDFVVNLR